ncbi:unnamed protein product [Cyprideis torosa]|uniref:Uncharacterized protein n=1 Tax=Cyprideis torosa TaxID=163714 RepID=A0A7R8WRW8_9CRUS|nr:unnamed protein product [Cyprideis torosa]CAG0904202.1 unnamed protein product [Cyprideis torosa]
MIRTAAQGSIQSRMGKPSTFTETCGRMDWPTKNKGVSASPSVGKDFAAK